MCRDGARGQVDRGDRAEDHGRARLVAHDVADGGAISPAERIPVATW